MKICWSIFPAILVLLPVGGATAAEPDRTGFEERVVPFLNQYCIDCHGEKDPQGGFEAYRMEPVSDSLMAEHWQNVSDVLGLGEMPPAKHPAQPEMAEVDGVMEWIHEELTRAQLVLANSEREVVLRRLTPLEYDHTIRDLLKINLDQLLPSELLPQEIETEGFTSNGAARVLSPAHLEGYIDAAGQILRHTVVKGAQPELFDKSWEANRQVFGGNLPEAKPDAEVWMEHVFHKPRLRPEQFKAHADGLYRVTVTARAIPPAMHEPGPRRWPSEIAVVRHRPDMPKNPESRVFVVEEDSETFSSDFYLKKGDEFRIEYFNGWALGPEHLKKWRRNGWFAHLILESMSIEGPIHETWPPPRHQTIFGAAEPEDSEEQALELIRQFAYRAFRRPTPDEFLEPFFNLYRTSRDSGADFHEGVQAALQGVLASPHFLYLLEPPGELDHYSIASRLSYFLWSTMPDDELFALATQGQLRNPDVLKGQVNRMLDDPRADDFITRFADEWLDTDRVAVMPPDERLYPEYDVALRDAMQAETRLFLKEMILNNLPVSNLVDSDFTILNERLADHYGLPGVEGEKMRRVALPNDDRRGGLLTQASILNVTSNGTTSSPVVRGVFVLDRILGNHPPPAPPDVPAIEPDIRGATTIREQLAKHREIPSCASCHAKIDPIGFALESYDVLGGWRENYRAVNPDKKTRKKEPYLQGPVVETADSFPGIGDFADIIELKERLKASGPMQKVERNFTERLLAFGMGRSLQFADQPQVDAILSQYRSAGGGTRTLLETIVTSDLFLNP